MSQPEPWLMALVAKNGLVNICRVCLASTNVDLGYKLINILESPNQETTSGFSIADALRSICAIEVSEDDHLPKSICPVCVCRLEEAHNLRQQSQTTQQALYEVLAEISQKDVCTTEYNTADFEIVSEEECVSDTEYDKEVLYEVEYLNEEMPLMANEKVDNKFKESLTSEQTKKKIRCCGCETAFDTELQLRKHSIRKHRPRSEIDVPDDKVPCNICYTLFPNKFKVAMHKRGKNNVQPLVKCKFCGCNFFTGKGMIKHRRQFHKGKRHKCCRCSFSSKDKNELIDHSICHKTNPDVEENTKAYLCKLCNLRFETLQERRLHERLPYKIRRKKHTALLTRKVPEEGTEEITASVHVCCGCGRVFSHMSELKTHQEVVHLPNRLAYTEENPVECTGCYKRFKTDNFLNQHLRRNAERKRFFCDKCTAVRLSLEEMMRHQLSHTGQNAFLCCGCKQRFETNELLEQHALQEHANAPKMYYNDEDDTVRPFQCKICYRRYKTARDLRGHQRFVYSERKLICEICGKGFRDKHTLTLHIATHKTEADFPCSICGNKYKHERQVHFCMIRHKRPRQHKCKICNVTFAAAANLYSHMVSHSDSRPYKCSICGVTYKRSFHLRKHMDVHSDKKHYRCKYCSAEFFSTSELYKHEIRHTGAYPYECEICNKKLSTRLVYIKHYEAHIEDSKKVFVCHLCPKKFSLDHFLSNHVKYKHRIEPQDKQWNQKFNRKGPIRLKGGRRLKGVRVYDIAATQDEQIDEDVDENALFELMNDFDGENNQ